MAVRGHGHDLCEQKWCKEVVNNFEQDLTNNRGHMANKSSGLKNHIA